MTNDEHRDAAETQKNRPDTLLGPELRHCQLKYTLPRLVKTLQLNLFHPHHVWGVSSARFYFLLVCVPQETGRLSAECEEASRGSPYSRYVGSYKGHRCRRSSQQSREGWAGGHGGIVAKVSQDWLQCCWMLFYELKLCHTTPPNMQHVSFPSPPQACEVYW